jgi:GAF domain-containing protein
VHIDPDSLTLSLAGLESRGLSADDDVPAGLLHVVEAAAEIFEVTGVGLMLVAPDQALRYVAASNESARELELCQEAAGVGPCVTAFVNEEIVRCVDLATDSRWPVLGPQLAEKGIRAVLGVPTRLGGSTVGSLNSYVDEPHEWDDGDVQAIAAYNRVIEGQLASALAAHRQNELVEQLEHALSNRVQIERAIGVLIARERLDAVAAFNRLRRAARSERRRVADVAAEVIAGRDLALDAPVPHVA